MEEAKRRYPADTSVNSVFAPCATAILEANRGNTARALDFLQSTSRYEVGIGYGFVPIYVRGVVYLRNRKGA